MSEISPANESRPRTSRRLLCELLAALVVVFLLLGPHLSQFLRGGPRIENMIKGRNAFWFLWRPHDIAVLLGCMLMLAAAAVVVREVLRAWGRRLPLRLFDHAFVVALGAGCLANLWFHTQRPQGYYVGQFGMEIQTAWLVLLGVVGYSLASPGSRLVAFCARACQIVSPALLIVTWQLMQQPTLAQRMDSLAPVSIATSARVEAARTASRRAPAEARTASLCMQQPPDRLGSVAGNDRPVYLFIFDEWSYRRTYHQGRCRSSLANIAALSQQAITFHRAHAPGAKTIISIPAILRGTTDTPEIDRLEPGFLKDGTFVPATQYPSLFTRAGCEDYRKIMVQWGFAVSLWAADELDVLRAYSCYPQGDGPLGDAALHLYNAAFFWTDPWTTFVYEKLKGRVQDAHTLNVYRRVDQDIRAIIRDQPARTFAVVHHPLPHPPYLLNTDGSYRGRIWTDHVCANEEGYERNLVNLDLAIGRLVGELKAAGRYDDALLVLTSDHSWRQDPAVVERTDEQLTHVPLIVKLPGQVDALDVHEEFRTHRLGELIGNYLRPESNAARLASTDTPSVRLGA